MNIYYYLFYRISAVLNKKHNNEWGVMYALSFLIYVNLIEFYVAIFNISSRNFNHGYKVGIIVIGILLFVGNYFIFLHKDRYKKIESKFRNEPVRKKKIRGVLIIVYIVITFLLVFFV